MYTIKNTFIHEQVKVVDNISIQTRGRSPTHRAINVVDNISIQTRGRSPTHRAMHRNDCSRPCTPPIPARHFSRHASDCPRLPTSLISSRHPSPHDKVRGVWMDYNVGPGWIHFFPEKDSTTVLKDPGQHKEATEETEAEDSTIQVEEPITKTRKEERDAKRKRKKEKRIERDIRRKFQKRLAKAEADRSFEETIRDMCFVDERAYISKDTTKKKCKLMVEQCNSLSYHFKMGMTKDSVVWYTTAAKKRYNQAPSGYEARECMPSSENGNCFFCILSYELGLGIRSLRRLLSNRILGQGAQTESSGTLLRKASRIDTDCTWTTDEDIKLTASLFSDLLPYGILLNIEGAREWSYFLPGTTTVVTVSDEDVVGLSSSDRSPLKLLYTKNHFLLLKKTDSTADTHIDELHIDCDNYDNNDSGDKTYNDDIDSNTQNESDGHHIFCSGLCRTLYRDQWIRGSDDTNSTADTYIDELDTDYDDCNENNSNDYKYNDDVDGNSDKERDHDHIFHDELCRSLYTYRDQRLVNISEESDIVDDDDDDHEGDDDDDANEDDDDDDGDDDNDDDDDNENDDNDNDDDNDDDGDGNDRDDDDDDIDDNDNDYDGDNGDDDDAFDDDDDDDDNENDDNRAATDGGTGGDRQRRFTGLRVVTLLYPICLLMVDVLGWVPEVSGGYL